MIALWRSCSGSAWHPQYPPDMLVHFQTISVSRSPLQTLWTALKSLEQVEQYEMISIRSRLCPQVSRVHARCPQGRLPSTVDESGFQLDPPTLRLGTHTTTGSTSRARTSESHRVLKSDSQPMKAVTLRCKCTKTLLTRSQAQVSWSWRIGDY